MKQVLFVTVTMVLVIFAPMSEAQSICSTATLKGYYGVQITGARPAPAVLGGVQALPGTTEQVIGVVVQIFDGMGNFTQTDNVKGSLSGITPNRPGIGTYSVNPDCSGTYTVNSAGSPPIVNQFVIVDNGDGFLTLVTSPQPVMVTAIGRKMSYLVSCPLNTPPTLSVVTNSNYSTTIRATDTITAWGQGFTPAGGNSLVFRRSGSGDVVLNESSGSTFWDYSTGQINAPLGGQLAAGVWTLTVQNACSPTPSNSIMVTVQ